jgi:predicted TIM-barrel fold metal-dependent hydrolase
VIACKNSNVYIGISWIVLWSVSAPRRFAELIGEAIRFAGPDRLVWGTDLLYDAEVRMKLSVEGFKNFQIPQDMIEGYGYEALTDETKRKIFGENLARLLNIETKRRIAKR